MNLKKKIREFFTLTRRNDGFTLVELIVVIAILAILAGVAVPAYSGYVTKANKQADITLVGEVKDALMLHYYNHFGEDTNGAVIITAEGVECEFAGSGDEAMKAVFGENWKDTVSLKYDGWKSTGVGVNWSGSTFDGKEEKLMQTVDKLSGTLEVFLDDYTGNAEGFYSFLDEKGIDYSGEDKTAAANAAVLYVGNSLKDVNQENVSAAFAEITDQVMGAYLTGGVPNTTRILLNAGNKIKAEVGGSKMVTAALMYAYAESFAAATNQELNVDLTNVTKGDDALDAIYAEFGRLMSSSNALANPERTQLTLSWAGYGPDGQPTGQTPYKKDAKAILSAMGAVNNVSDVLMENIGKSDLYSTSTDLVKSYLNASAKCEDGEVLVMITNGKVVVDGLSE